METPSFTFRLERVKSLRERAEARAQEDLASELRLRPRGEAMLRAATNAASEAVQTAREVTFAPASAGYLLAAQTHIGRAHRDRAEAALDLDRRDVEVAARQTALQSAARRAGGRDRPHAHDDPRDAGARPRLDRDPQRLSGEPVDLWVNGKPIARGEVVVIDEEFGLRVTEVVAGEPGGDPVPAPEAEAPASVPAPAPQA